MSDKFDYRRQIDALCNEFEDSWSESLQPDFESLLLRVETNQRGELLRELLEVDVAMRLAADQAIDSAEYIHLGEDAVIIVAEVLMRRDLQQSPLNADETRSLNTPSSKNVPRQIGPYKLLQQIGEGGMGTVWMADQQEPIRRRVALKVMKAGMDSKQVIARFEAERQALAMMDHQNIAKVLDAGTTADGKPYFVMELVQGELPINEYCDKNRLSLQRRLELFLAVCQAVQHAHQKGIIHRDLKPSNVLVTQFDGEPVPKVIDFGLAKALQHQTHLTDKTLFTEFGQIAGTLQYMSPEQAEMNSLDVDTRTDIYSLGVMLYELLTGSTPLERKTLEGKAFRKLLELVSENEPPRPSKRLSDSGEAISGISEQRKCEPRRLQQILKGDLDWIVMKSLDKDRTRRYQTAAGFAADVNRFLNNEPVAARPPSMVYRTRKFVRRNKGLVASLAAVSATCVIGLAGTSWGFYREKSARIDAQITAKRTEDVLAVVVGAFDNVNPEKNGSAEMTANQVLLNAYQQLHDSDLDSTGRVELLRSLNICFIQLGDYKSAISTAKEAIELSTGLYGEQSEETLFFLNNLALSLRYNGQLGQAIEAYEACINVLRKIEGPENRNTITTMYNLARAYEVTGDVNRAEELAKEAYSIASKVYGRSDPITLNAQNMFAGTLVSLGRVEDAIPIYEDLRDLRQEVLSGEHPDTLTALNNLALAYAETSRHVKAIELLNQVVSGRQSKLGPSHPETLQAQESLAHQMFTIGKFEHALDEFQQVLAARQHELPAKHPHIVQSRLFIGRALVELDRLDEGILELEQAEELAEAILNGTDPRYAWVMTHLARALRKDGKYGRARTLLEQAVSSLKKSPGEGHQMYMFAHEQLGITDLDAGSYEQAETNLRHTLKLYEEHNPTSWRASAIESLLGEALFHQDRIEEAGEHLEKAGISLFENRDQIPALYADKTYAAVERLIRYYDKLASSSPSSNVTERIEECEQRLRLLKESFAESTDKATEAN